MTVIETWKRVVGFGKQRSPHAKADSKPLAPIPKALLGKWELQGENPWIDYEITIQGRRPKVVATYTTDGEKLQVSKLSFVNGVLTFDTRDLSTGYHARHRVAAMTQNRLRHEMKTIETWKRVP